MPPDDAYTMMQQGVDDQAMSDPGMDPQLAAPGQMDPGAMAALFGDEGGGEMPVDDGSMPVDDGSQGPPPDQAPDQAGGEVDQGKLQSVLSDPGLLMAVAQVLKTLGAGDDTDLVHVTEEEKAMLQQAGGAGTPNPTTGLLQYFGERQGDTFGGAGGASGADATDWYGMHPDDRVAAIAARAPGVPGWNNNWWTSPREATQGSPTKNMTGEDFANANVAVTPSWGTALNMAGLVTGMATGPGVIGGILGALKTYAADKLSTAILGKNMLTGSSSFDTPGPRLSEDEVAEVAAAYNDAALRGLPTGQVLNAGQQKLAEIRGRYGGGEGAQTGGPGPGMSAGIGVDAAGHAYGTNIGGAGISHNMAAAGPATTTNPDVESARIAAGWAAANAARSFAAGGYGRATPAGGGGGRGGGDAGGGRSDGGNRGGGQEGGRHGGPGGSSRSD